MNDQLREILATVLELDPAEIREELTPADVEVWDSFTHVMLVTNLEERFGMRLDPTEATEIRSVADIGALLRKRGIK